MDLAYYLYTLTPVKRLNALTDTSSRGGVLFCIDKKYYLDYFPWQEFGDLTCLDLLMKVKDTGFPPFMKQLLELEIDKEHIKHDSFLNHGFNDKEAEVVKLKVLDLQSVIKQIDDVRATSIRLDFNGAYSTDEVVDFWNLLPERNKKRIEYIEDITKDDSWERLKQIGIPLASDRIQFKSDRKILKPNIDLINENTKEHIYSSYMGHNLGIYHCYLSLMKYGDLSKFHGIDTPDIYQEQSSLFNRNKNECNIDKVKVHNMYELLGGLDWTSI